MIFQTRRGSRGCGGHSGYGLCLLKGCGVSRNTPEAALYLKLSSDQGDAGGQINYGRCLLKGKGVSEAAETLCG